MLRVPHIREEKMKTGLKTEYVPGGLKFWENPKKYSDPLINMLMKCDQSQNEFQQVESS